jgi:hypothetical protein
MERAKPKLSNKEADHLPHTDHSPLPHHLRDEISSILADVLLADLQQHSESMAKTPPGFGHKCSLTDNLQSAMTLARLQSDKEITP